ncbi:MAG: sugar phosphate nucleotidyltransferase [Thermoguttaceae bacterium]
MEKAVILARGLGKRMRRADSGVALDERQQAVADTGVKALIPIGRPFLDYVLSGLADAGYRRVCLVVAPDHEVLRRYYEELKPARVQIEFAVQVEPKGTGDAVAAAKAFAGLDPFLVVNSDNYYPAEALAGLRELTRMGAALFEQEAMFARSNISADRIRQFAVGRISAAGHLEKILEKPDDATLASLPRPLWLSMNCWRFGPAIFEACAKIAPSPRGEMEITDAVQYAIDVLGEALDVVKVRAAVLDMTSRKDVATIAPKLAGIEVRL